MKQKIEIQNRMNLLGRQRIPFGFLIDFDGSSGIMFDLSAQDDVKWEIDHTTGMSGKLRKSIDWKIDPVPFSTYQEGFNQVMQHILNGDTYLLNYTQPTPVETNLSLGEIYECSRARYKIFLKDQFVCFSPETFVRINNGKISSFPMKGTIDASVKNAEQVIMKDSKELAEHNTIVDLIRNDLSLVAEDVEVEKFRFLQKIHTHNSSLWQVSSQISGRLPANYHERIGDILFAMLPAGSVTGAPKPKTVDIIRKTENYDRGFYTGIFGIFNGMNLDSCVLIRFIEKAGNRFIYKSGGGITFMSDARTEYNELVKKVYVPVV